MAKREKAITVENIAGGPLRVGGGGGVVCTTFLVLLP